MKTLISILLLFYSFVSYSQTSFSDTLTSKYIWGWGCRLILDESMNFDYFVYGCTGDYFGKGKYEINKEILTLYIKYDSINHSPYTIKDFICESDTSNIVNLKFTVLDEEEKPLKAATILIKKLSRGANTKSEGKAIISKIPKNQNIEVIVNYVGYSPIRFNINTNVCKDIVVRMNNEKYFPEGTVMKYEINKFFNFEHSTVLYNSNNSLTLTKIYDK